MNRAQRRAAERAGISEIAISYAENYRCPDCDATTDLDVDSGVAVLRIAHDDTCPVYRSRVASFTRARDQFHARGCTSARRCPPASKSRWARRERHHPADAMAGRIQWIEGSERVLLSRVDLPAPRPGNSENLKDGEPTMTDLTSINWTVGGVEGRNRRARDLARTFRPNPEMEAALAIAAADPHDPRLRPVRLQLADYIDAKAAYEEFGGDAA